MSLFSPRCCVVPVVHTFLYTFASLALSLSVSLSVCLSVSLSLCSLSLSLSLPPPSTPTGLLRQHLRHHRPQVPAPNLGQQLRAWRRYPVLGRRTAVPNRTGLQVHGEDWRSPGLLHGQLSGVWLRLFVLVYVCLCLHLSLCVCVCVLLCLCLFVCLCVKAQGHVFPRQPSSRRLFFTFCFVCFFACAINFCCRFWASAARRFSWKMPTTPRAASRSPSPAPRPPPTTRT